MVIKCIKQKSTILHLPQSVLLHAGLIGRWRRPMLELGIDKTVRRPSTARSSAAPPQIAATT